MVVQSVNAALLAHKLKKFQKIAKLSQSYAADIPLWSTIIFEPERTLYLGWRFQVEAPPILEVKDTVMVNFDHLETAVRTLSETIEVLIDNEFVCVGEKNNTEGAEFQLNRQKIDFKNFLIDVPKDIVLNKAYEGMLEDIQWAMVGSTKDRMDYQKYGVMLTKNSMIAMDTESAVAYVDKPTGIDQSVLLHLPWCNILTELGEISQYAQWDAEGQTAYLYFVTEDDYRLTIPVLKIRPNPSIEQYVKSFTSHLTIYVDPLTIKQLLITTDDAYQHATVYTLDGFVYLESESNTKGKTTIKIGEGKGLDNEAVSVSLFFLKKIAHLTGRLDIDLDNLVGFVRKGSYVYGFALG